MCLLPMLILLSDPYFLGLRAPAFLLYLFPACFCSFCDFSVLGILVSLVVVRTKKKDTGPTQSLGTPYC